jgi:hypothetical protein
LRMLVIPVLVKYDLSLNKNLAVNIQSLTECCKIQWQNASLAGEWYELLQSECDRVQLLFMWCVVYRNMYCQHPITLPAMSLAQNACSLIQEINGHFHAGSIHNVLSQA